MKKQEENMKQQKKTKSIGEKMKSTHTYQRQEEILLDWADAWEKDFNKTHELIRQAVRAEEKGLALRYSDQLTALTQKRFQALENIIYKVCDPKRIMKDQDAIGGNPVEPEHIAPPESTLEQPDATSQPESMTPQGNQETLAERVVRYYKQGKDAKEIAIMCEISDHKTIKILVTAGIFQGETYDRIKTLRADGKTDVEICDILKVKERTLDRYTPYKKGMYPSETPTENALKIRKSRGKSER